VKGAPGPGRGAFQYEMKALGGSGGSTTAVKRFKNTLKDLEVEFDISPEEQAVIDSDDPDLSKLPLDLQEAIFFSDKYQHPTFALDKLVTGKLDQKEAYRKYHYGGPEVDRINKHWDDSMKSYPFATP
jgi:hypothetical protein